jgi:hypothetical protein
MDHVTADANGLILEVGPGKRSQELRLVDCDPVVVAGDPDGIALERVKPLGERADDPVPRAEVAGDQHQVARRGGRQCQAV